LAGDNAAGAASTVDRKLRRFGPSGRFMTRLSYDSGSAREIHRPRMGAEACLDPRSAYAALAPSADPRPQLRLISFIILPQLHYEIFECEPLHKPDD
jgi:hypothetical protein